MIGSGVFEVEIDGKKVGFEFCPLAAAYTEEISKSTIFEVFQNIAKGMTMPVIDYFYGGARAYNEFRDIKDKVTRQQASRYIEKMGFEKATEIYTQSIEMYLPKNGKAPVVTGQDV